MNKKRLLDFKNGENYFRHLTELFELQINQFEYDGLPDTLPHEFLEMFLLINGHCAIGKPDNNSDVYCAIGSYNDDYNGYLPKGYTAAVTDIGEISGNWYGDDKSIVVAKNNNMGIPEFDIPFTANVLQQIDISEECNVIFARFARLPFADNDKEKQQIESYIKSIIRGDLIAVATRTAADSFEQFIEGQTEKEKFFDMVDVDKIDGLQYLNQYRDNILKRFLCRRGYMVQTTSKLAQQTNTEMHGADSFAFLYPLQQLKQREKMCNDINAMFGLNVSVKFNPILEKVFKDYMTEPKNDDLQGEKETPNDPELLTEQDDNNDEKGVNDNDPNSEN